MNTFLGVSADLSPEDVDESAIGDSEYVYIEGYLVTGPASKKAALYAVQQARASGAKIAFSLSDPNIVHFFRPAINELIGDGVDLLFANEDEARRIAETDNLDDAIDYLKRIAKQFVVTCGADGAVAFDGRTLHRIAPVPTRAVDTVGAGDMFAGAFLYGITQGMDYQQAGNLASLASSRIVSSMGPRLKLGQLQGSVASVSRPVTLRRLWPQTVIIHPNLDPHVACGRIQRTSIKTTEHATGLVPVQSTLAD